MRRSKGLKFTLKTLKEHFLTDNKILENIQHSILLEIFKQNQ